jgi:hypothetical protein
LEEAEHLLAEGEQHKPGYDSGTCSRSVGTSTQNGNRAARLGLEETPLLSKPGASEENGAGVKAPSSFLLTYTIVPLVLTFWWFAIAIHQVVALKSSPLAFPTATILLAIIYFASSISFVTTPFRPTPPYGLILLYVTLFLSATMILGNDIYAWKIHGGTLNGVSVVAWSVNLAALGLLISVGVTRPFSIPSPSIDQSQIVSIDAPKSSGKRID